MNKADERISELEDKTIEITKYEQRENRLQVKTRDSRTCGTAKKKKKNNNIHVIGRSRENRVELKEYSDKKWLEMSQIGQRM